MIDGIPVVWNIIENYLLIWVLGVLTLTLLHFGQKGPY